MTPKPNDISRRHQIATLALNLGLGLFAGLSVLPLHAQDEDNIPVGYTEDEWYDPTDWFDGNNIKPAETDWSDNDGWSNSDNYANDNGYNYDYDHGYGWTTYDKNDYDWSNKANNSGLSTNDKNRNTNTSTGKQAERNEQQNQSTKTVSFDGKVESFKKVNLKNREGKSDEHTFARIRLQNDQTRVVSLGSRVDLSDLDLQKNDRISVSGRNVRIDNRDVLVASQIEVGDKRFNIRKANRPQAGQQVSINGMVKDSSVTSLSNGSRKKNLLVRLELENGRSCVVDLGQDTSLSYLDIENGSEIRLQGEKTEVNGKSLIVARKISVDGDSTRLRMKAKGMDTKGKDTKGNDVQDKDAKGNKCPHCNRDSRQGSDRDTGSDTLESVSRNRASD